MSKPNQLIGNEHFKTWLKKLDPVARVEKMSAIAKIQSAAGLKGSLIKASLAQLSQRCRVMLIKLTEKEIHYHTRRKTVKRLLQPKSKLQLQTSSDKISSKPEISNEAASTSKDSRHTQSKLIQKYQELFGDDFEEPQITKGALESSIGSCKTSVNNYLSTTVNVNIYNSKKGPKSDTTILKRKQEGTGAILNLGQSSPKRVTIDVSLSTDKSRSDEKQKSKLKSKHSHSKSKKTKNKNKANGIQQSKLAFVNSPEEDPTIKELWSIFGMQSPTDRSVGIRSECATLPTNTDDNSTVYKATLEKDIDSDIAPPLQDLQAKEKVQEDNLRVSVIQKNVFDKQIPENSSEPVCKITGAFSLAGINCSESLFDSPNQSNSGEQLTSAIINKSVSKDNDCNMVVETKNGDVLERLPKEIETISILDDDDDDDSDHVSSNADAKEGEAGSNHSMVGTIRVKNLGLLMNPQLMSPTDNAITHHNTASTVDLDRQATNQDSSNEAHRNSISEDRFNPPPDVEERFIATYNHYFVEVVELKIPKLGELLHLAITDEIRRKDRIKRAEQLSSNDLILEEKLRAEKDFNEMMKTRGTEFTPLCEFILDSFDELSKCTLFCALFCRILKHAEKIDPTNKHYVLEARHVLAVMLSKHNFKYQDVLGYLEIDQDEFKNTIKLINHLLEKCTNYKSKEAESSKRTLPPIANNSENSDKGNTSKELFESSNSPPTQNIHSAPNVTVRSSDDHADVNIQRYPTVSQTYSSAPIASISAPNNNFVLSPMVSTCLQPNTSLQSNITQMNVAVVSMAQNMIPNKPKTHILVNNHLESTTSNLKGSKSSHYQTVQVRQTDNPMKTRTTNSRQYAVTQAHLNINPRHSTNNLSSQKPVLIRQIPETTSLNSNSIQGLPIEKIANKQYTQAKSPTNIYNISPDFFKNFKTSTAQPTVGIDNSIWGSLSGQNVLLKYPQRTYPQHQNSQTTNNTVEKNTLLSTLLSTHKKSKILLDLRKNTLNPSTYNNESPTVPPVPQVSNLLTPTVSRITSYNHESPQSTSSVVGKNPSTLKPNNLPYVVSVLPPVANNITQQVTITPVGRTQPAVPNRLPTDPPMTVAPTATNTVHTSHLATITAVPPNRSVRDSTTSSARLPTSVPQTLQIPVEPLVQTPVPSSSHCHPFLKRMPPSGKMKMFFEK